MSGFMSKSHLGSYFTPAWGKPSWMRTYTYICARERVLRSPRIRADRDLFFQRQLKPGAKLRRSTRGDISSDLPIYEFPPSLLNRCCKRRKLPSIDWCVPMGSGKFLPRKGSLLTRAISICPRRSADVKFNLRSWSLGTISSR